MIFTETRLNGAYIIDTEPHVDDRGFFARAWCQNEFKDHGLNPGVVQINAGFSHKRGTLRGMHYQTDPCAEVKLIRCTLGAIYDVIIDLRPDSPTHKQWIAVELTQENHLMLYVPEGFAHGYMTLMDNTEMFYQTTREFSRDHATGVRYNDLAFDIDWPLPIAVISEQDKNWPEYNS